MFINGKDLHARRRRLGAVLAALCALFITGQTARAVTFSFSSGTFSASADFTVSGDELIIELTNTSLYDVREPADVLTALFFDLTPSPALRPLDVRLVPGSTVQNGSVPDGDVSSEWAFRQNLTGIPGGAGYGVSSVGLDAFGPHDRFDTTKNLAGPESPNGLEYGILSTGDDPLTGNRKVIQETLVRDAVIIRLKQVPTGFDLNLALSNVWFQYGTDFAEPRFPGDKPPNGGGGGEPTGPGIPEPASAALAAVALAALLTSTTRRRIR